jgi:hypothetical protein
MKTIAARMFDELNISYELRAYEVSESQPPATKP